MSSESSQMWVTHAYTHTKHSACHTDVHIYTHAHDLHNCACMHVNAPSAVDCVYSLLLFQIELALTSVLEKESCNKTQGMQETKGEVQSLHAQYIYWSSFNNRQLNCAMVQSPV